MTKSVHIKGLGKVEFADNLDEKQIVSVIKEKLLPKRDAKKPEPPTKAVPPKQEKSPQEDLLIGAIAKLSEQAQNSKAYLQSLDKIVDTLSGGTTAEAVGKLAAIQEKMSESINLLTTLATDRNRGWRIEITDRDLNGNIKMLDINRQSETIN